MTPTAYEVLFKTLEEDFCPPLDPPLIAAFLHEIQFDRDGTPVEPTTAQIRDLRTTLKELSLQAEDVQNSESSELRLASQLDETISSWTTLSCGDNYQSSDLTNGCSASSSSSVYSFGSPLGFLQTALPDVPISRLRMALEAHGGDDLDLGDIIANILTEEAIRDMEERGIDGLEDKDETFGSVTNGVDWETVKSKKSKTKSPVKRHPNQSRPKKIALSDIRQQHHHVQTPTRKGKSRSISSPATPISTAITDPWTQVSSLSTQLSSLLPSCPPSTFSSFFHSPNYANSYDAARAALFSLGKPPSDISEEHTTMLFHLLDVVLPAYEDLDIEQRSRVISDVELAVAVTGGQGDAALDIVNLLRDLDTDINLGLIHSPPTPVLPSTSSPWSASVAGPPDVLPPTPITRSKKPPDSLKTSPYDWQDVPERPKRHGPNPHAQFIPAYARANAANKAKLNTNGSQLRLQKAMEKRNRALMDAAVMWQKGNMKNRGGEVALYYAERARDLQAVAKQEALNAARVMVRSTRVSSDNHDTIDLHGTKVAEAVVIVKEILNESLLPGKPLKIITGRGNHSAGRVSVLKPAVKNALVHDGWNVSSFDGGLVVRDRHG